MSVRTSERARALAANAASYDARAEREFVSGAPHLKHASVAAIYEGMVERALASLGRPAREVSVLEVGAGDGRASVAWLRRGVRLTAIDSSSTMLARLRARAEGYGVPARTQVGDAVELLERLDRRFDVVTHVSMLHHVPGYLELLDRSAAAVAPHGCLLTFQDPLRYDRLPRVAHAADRAAYFAWRLAQGNLRQGLRTRLRRLRGRYDPDEPADYEEYHVVRNGLDSEAMRARLAPCFGSVSEVRYWATQGAPWQWLGERLGLRTEFGVVAIDRRRASR